MWLDTRHRAIETEHVFTGTIDGCEVQPRIVAKCVPETNAAAVVLFHHHPSGKPEPSAADRAVNSRLKQVPELLGGRILDRIVLGGKQAESLAARGWV
ncbi:hypothetical protein XarbCFBP8150_00565 [Xanthomonas arboricola]|nr:hypothetical protein XarbCFBP8150_00565 [Xanthomonas arboricola]